ncbi:MAG: DUF2384 domain-containing protein [Proteobacteria bacterium]|nr:DUF2384 domain-containing protein [Pseudomonadota bacterium]
MLCGDALVQKPLTDEIDIIRRVIPWAGSEFAARAWFRSQTLAGFGDRTAQDLVQAGRADAVRGYLARIGESGFS